jgi:hypothetical protein
MVADCAKRGPGPDRVPAVDLPDYQTLTAGDDMDDMVPYVAGVLTDLVPGVADGMGDWTLHVRRC